MEKTTLDNLEVLATCFSICNHTFVGVLNTVTALHRKPSLGQKTASLGVDHWEASAVAVVDLSNVGAVREVAVPADVLSGRVADSACRPKNVRALPVLPKEAAGPQAEFGVLEVVSQCGLQLNLIN